MFSGFRDFRNSIVELSAFARVHSTAAWASAFMLSLAVPIAYATDRRDADFRSFLDTWLLLKRDDGTIERLRRYWIAGIDDGPRTPRWSVVRNLLGWVR